jgi:hypothetical protein
MNVVDLQGARRNAAVMQLAADEIHDGRLVAAAARDGHHGHHELHSLSIGNCPMIDTRF